VIGLGTSLGSKRRNIGLAIRLLGSDSSISICSVSRLYCSPPIGAAIGSFLNAAISIQTSYSPMELLKVCKDVEGRLGRKPTERWGDRVIDLDILLFGNQCSSDPMLSLPHPGLLSRGFCYHPAVEIAGEHLHPEVQLRLRDIPPPADGSCWVVDVLPIAGTPRTQ
jgi:2-amino-4-hydroxy-6-hydroxymethyldihydropteridine diphosphokinase